ncbi:hypothetical protein [Pseudomonas mangiferae]|uniref:Uncharacterized protein n=1 Tax=Pseudomonas mangiferae TaxID=2593654 RepID=A0A553GUB8_9PSED|nr:hypothetical protein [Pseudomonas mangiferae]TRX73082.1 hypothetical protein FM069_19335 [Pseudomonas mangiferae]
MARKQGCIWSEKFHCFYDSHEGPELSAQAACSPNHIFYISSIERKLMLVNHASSTVLATYVNPGLMEISWAPNSNAFSINVSDGGGVGSWGVDYYTVDGNGLPQKHDVTIQVSKASEKLAKCDEQEEPNIAMLSWLNNGQGALMVAEVPPHSSCSNMGALQGYRVNLSGGEILEVLSESELRQKWGRVLGDRIKRIP